MLHNLSKIKILNYVSAYLKSLLSKRVFIKEIMYISKMYI